MTAGFLCMEDISRTFPAPAAGITAAMICEYNPFHNGHRYHIGKTRELYGAENIIAVMSGSFVQRGDCAVYTKQTRAKAALMCGADLVIELPLPWSMSPAECFAFGGVSLAAALGADMLSFGSECGDIGRLSAAADILEDPRLYELTRGLQKEGISFAAARSRAAAELAGEDTASALETPNDILGVEYIRAINRTGCGIIPVCVRREGAGHDRPAQGDSQYISASQLRARIRAGRTEKIRAGVPENAAELYENAGVMSLERIDRLIVSELRQMSRGRLAALPDVSEGLENRLYDAAGRAASFEELCEAVKSKRYAMSRVRRVILGAALGIPAGLGKTSPPYIRLLGMNARGEELVRKGFGLPVVAGYKDTETLSGTAREVYELNRRASEIFAMCAERPLGRGCDFAGGVIKL